MKVKAATVEQHEFAVRRRGYDQAEVDAVMGRLSDSLHSYEREIEELEARLSNAERTRPEAVQREVELIRMESEQMKQRAAETLTKARQQAQELLDAARGEIDKLFSSLNDDAIEVLNAAERDAAAQHEAAAAEAGQVLADARSNADQLTTKATEAAQVRRDEAAEKAAAIVAEAEGRAEQLVSDANAAAARTREEAAAEAAEILTRAHAEHDRLAERIPELRNALSQFEAQVHALAATESVVDLNQIEAEEAAVAETAAATESATDSGPGPEAAAEVVANGDAVPVPDGSGTLPAARDLVDLASYRELRAEPGEPPAADESASKAETEEPAEDSRGLDRLAGSHIARRVPGSDTTETIYQRRGGGLRRRIKAQGDE